MTTIAAMWNNRTNAAFASSSQFTFRKQSGYLRRLSVCPRRFGSGVTMQIPPAKDFFEVPLTEAQRGPPGYKWDPNYPGTLKPGLSEDNFPLEEVLESGVYEKMQFEELDIDDRTPLVFPPDEDLLEWLAKEGRLLPRDASEDEFDLEAQKHISGITEEDLEYSDDDEKMIEYYSKQGEGSALGAGSDFGGFSESFIDTPADGFNS